LHKKSKGTTTPIATFNKLLNNKNNLLYKELKEDPPINTLSNLLLQLIDENYNFNQGQINKIFNQITYKKYSYDSAVITSNQLVHKKIITYMLTNCDISDDNITSILAYAPNLTNLNIINYIGLLFLRKFNFTNYNFSLLLQAKYYNPPLDNYDAIHNNVFFGACAHIFYPTDTTKSNYDKCIDLLDKTEFNIEYLNIFTLLFPFPIPTELMFVLIKKILSKCENIFEMISNSEVNYCSPIINTILNIYGYDDLFEKYIFESVISCDSGIFLNIFKG
jgi:hypothetical protein